MPVSCVDYDNHAMVQQAVHRFAAAGHQRIAFLGFQPTVPAVMKPMRVAFVDALLDHGLIYDYRDYWVTPHMPTEVASDHEAKAAAGYHAAQSVLSLDQPPTAWIVMAERMVPGIEAALREQQLSVPGDVSLIVDYDFTEDARYSGFTNPHWELGRRLIYYLDRSIRDPYYFVQELLEKPYVERGSVVSP